MTSAGEARPARKTAVMVGLVLLALGGWSLWRNHPVRAGTLGGLAVLLLLIGAFVPAWALGFHAAWMRFAAVLGYVNSRIVLGLMYYGVLTPLGVMMRVAGRDTLRRRGKSGNSYWIPRPKARQDREQFERLF